MNVPCTASLWRPYLTWGKALSYLCVVLFQVLCLHLKRFHWTAFLRNKVDTYVEFPLHSLDMRAFLLEVRGTLKWFRKRCLDQVGGCECQHSFRLAYRAPNILYISRLNITFTFTFREFSRRIHPKWLTISVAAVLPVLPVLRPTPITQCCTPATPSFFFSVIKNKFSKNE
jgi:hypothetical protein